MHSHNNNYKGSLLPSIFRSIEKGAAELKCDQSIVVIPATISRSGFYHIAQGIKANDQINALDLSQFLVEWDRLNQVHNEKGLIKTNSELFICIARDILSHKTIKKLILDEAYIDNLSAKALVEPLKTTRIAHFSLQYCRFESTEAVFDIIQAISHNENIHQLNLFGSINFNNPVDSEMLGEWHRIMKGRLVLDSITLEFCKQPEKYLKNFV